MRKPSKLKRSGWEFRVTGALILLLVGYYIAEKGTRIMKSGHHVVEIKISSGGQGPGGHRSTDTQVGTLRLEYEGLDARMYGIGLWGLTGMLVAWAIACLWPGKQPPPLRATLCGALSLGGLLMAVIGVAPPWRIASERVFLSLYVATVACAIWFYSLCHMKDALKRKSWVKRSIAILVLAVLALGFSRQFEASTGILAGFLFAVVLAIHALCIVPRWRNAFWEMVERSDA